MTSLPKFPSSPLKHGPDHAEHELRKAYNCIIEAGVTYTLCERNLPEINPAEATETYRNAFQLYQTGKRLAAERWARAAKHLARAFWHEAKIAYLEPRLEQIPYLTGALDEEYHLHEREDSTVDLLTSLQDRLPQVTPSQLLPMKKYLTRARHHLEKLSSSSHELLRAERIKVAYEYSRVIECLSLGYEAEASPQEGAA